MNIFCVDKDPAVAAVALVDRHVVKMILESTQLLSLAHNILGGPPKPECFWRNSLAWQHHPCAKWARSSLSNYRWLAAHNVALCDEYTHRYGKTHKVRLDGIDLWLLEHVPHLDDVGLTPFAEATGDIHTDDPILTYRKYYLECKRHLMVWTRRNPPEWIAEALQLTNSGDRWMLAKAAGVQK